MLCRTLLSLLFPPDTVTLSSLHLPGLEGLQAAFKELKELTGTKEQAMAALSADGESQYSKVLAIMATNILASSISIHYLFVLFHHTPHLYG